MAEYNLKRMLIHGENVRLVVRMLFVTDHRRKHLVINLLLYNLVNNSNMENFQPNLLHVPSDFTKPLVSDQIIQHII